MECNFWLFGLSGAGKTTIGDAMAKAYPCTRLDGDILRAAVCSDLGFSSYDRSVNIDRAISIAAWEIAQGRGVIATFMTPYKTMQKEIRRRIPGVKLVYIQCPIEVCRERDPKGLYAKNLPNMVEKLDEPLFDICVDTSRLMVDECVQQILGYTCAKCRCVGECLCACHYRKP